MARRRMLERFAVVWAITGAGVALLALPQVNPDARPLVLAASVAFPASAGAAALALRRCKDRTAGGLLLVSVGTPTYFAYPINLPALFLALALLTAPSAVLPRKQYSEN